MAKGMGGLKRIPIKIIETEVIYESIRACARAIDGHDRGVRDCLNGKRKIYLGYTFEFIEENIEYFDDY